MFSIISIFLAAAMIQLLQAQENGPEYVFIVAGENPLSFVHPETPAGLNDVLVWMFSSGENHSVIQSTYENPCHYKPGGFNSGFVSVPPRAGGGSQTGPVQFHVTVNDTEPIYYYCGQIGHCQSGMVGVINPPCIGNGINSTGSYNVYKSLAIEVTSVGPLPSAVVGGQLLSDWPFPTGGPPGSPGPSYTGFSASCTAGSNSSEPNSTESTTTSFTTIATASTLSFLLSTTTPVIFPPSSLIIPVTTSTTTPTLPLSLQTVLSFNLTTSVSPTITNTTSTSISTATTATPGIQVISSSGCRRNYDGDISFNYRLLILIFQVVAVSLNMIFEIVVI